MTWSDFKTLVMLWAAQQLLVGRIARQVREAAIDLDIPMEQQTSLMQDALQRMEQTHDPVA